MRRLISMAAIMVACGAFITIASVRATALIQRGSQLVPKPTSVLHKSIEWQRSGRRDLGRQFVGVEAEGVFSI